MPTAIRSGPNFFHDLLHEGERLAGAGADDDPLGPRLQHLADRFFGPQAAAHLNEERAGLRHPRR